MNVEEFRNHCLEKAHVEETMPFDDTTLVFKLNNKMFALLSLKEERRNTCSLKCDPERAIQFREEFSAVKPGYHMNKKHWNSVLFNHDVSDEMIFQMVDDSYALIFKSFSKKVQKELSE